MTPTSPRAPLPWVALVVGLAAEAASLVAGAALCAYHAATYDWREDDYQGDSLNVGGMLAEPLYVVGAIVVLAVAMVVGVAILLARNPRSRLASLVLAVTVQVPIVAAVLFALDGGIGAAPLATVVSAAVVLLAAASPSTWHWCLRPSIAHDVVGQPAAGRSMR